MHISAAGLVAVAGNRGFHYRLTAPFGIPVSEGFDLQTLAEASKEYARSNLFTSSSLNIPMA